MRRRSRIASGALAIAAVVVACGPPAGTLFRTTLSADDGSYSMPVTLGDQTGLVVAVDPGEGGELGTPEPSVVADPANARVLVVSWMGGACEDETVIGFWPTATHSACT